MGGAGRCRRRGLGDRGRHQLGVELGRSVAAVTDRRAHPDDVGRHSAQLAPGQLSGDGEARARRARASDQVGQLGLGQPAVQAAAVLDERVDERPRDARPVDQLGQPRGSERRGIERVGVRIGGGDHRGFGSHRVRHGAHQRHGLVELAHPPQPDLDVVGAAERGAARGQRRGVREVGHVTQGDAHRGGRAHHPHHLGEDARRGGTERSFARILDVDDVRSTGEGAARLLRGDDADQQPHARACPEAPRATQAPRRSKSTTLTSVPAPAATRSRSATSGGELGAIDDPVDRGAPRALSHRSDAQRQQRVDQRRRARMKDATLLGGEHRSHLALDLGERDAELVDVARQQSGQQRGQQQPRHAGLGARRLAQLAEEALLRIPGESSTPRGSASTHRHRSGIG